MQLGQFSASVSVDGIPLPEYAPEYSTAGTEATCWIPSENGKNFKVEWTNDQASPTCLISGHLWVDGIHCSGRLMKATDNPTFSTGSRDSVASSSSARRPLVFSKQALTDDDQYLNASISPNLGMIRLRIRQVRRDGQRPRVALAEDRTFDTQMLHERTKKAVGHSVQFGAEFASSKPNKSFSTRVVQELVTFVFRYRPMDLLQAEGIAPPPVKKELASSSEDVLDLTVYDDDEADEAEIQKLEARLGALKNKRKRVKREQSSDRVKKEIKTESSFDFKPGEVIDLT
ncbi:hypothetical protein FB45DRAFT_938121 [Roridomyces roridus]|uniref:DUF7918 domain-containing protein n=1 Tax=Roridomyces roridus TaxID=1738132 RepID=A0AAD7B9E9_9AGAR|nr:hypothetical protein FB45DRAFT_938121 [Roridomyces roridus]